MDVLCCVVHEGKVLLRNVPRTATPDDLRGMLRQKSPLCSKAPYMNLLLSGKVLTSEPLESLGIASDRYILVHIVEAPPRHLPLAQATPSQGQASQATQNQGQASQTTPFQGQPRYLTESQGQASQATQNQGQASQATQNQGQASQATPFQGQPRYASGSQGQASQSAQSQGQPSSVPNLNETQSPVPVPPPTERSFTLKQLEPPADKIQRVAEFSSQDEERARYALMLAEGDEDKACSLLTTSADMENPIDQHTLLLWESGFRGFPKNFPAQALFLAALGFLSFSPKDEAEQEIKQELTDELERKLDILTPKLPDIPASVLLESLVDARFNVAKVEAMRS